jgi:hypothetical protein
MIFCTVIIAALRSLRIVGIGLLASVLIAGVAWAGAVKFLIDSEPVSLGRDVVIDFNPSTLAPRAETPDSIAFLLPARWRFDHRSVARECTAAQAAAVRCPAASRIGYGHVVIHVQGYLFPGGETDAVSYVTPYLGRPQQAGDRASMVLEVELLGVDPLINAANRYLQTKIKKRYSIVGRIVALKSGAYGLKTSFSGFPGGITVPPALASAGVSVSIRRFDLWVGAVRRVRKPTIHRIEAPTASGGTQTITIHDHVLVGHHLLRRGRRCPAGRRWPWRIQVGFPDGAGTLVGSVRCG